MKDIGELLDTELAKSKETNQKMILEIFQNIRYLARQPLPCRGNWCNEEKSEINSNFYQLLLLRSKDDKVLTSWVKKK